MIFRGTYRNPLDLAHSMALVVNLDDACTECGYQFAYEPEGCDDCKAITDLLIRVGLSRQEET